MVFRFGVMFAVAGLLLIGSMPAFAAGDDADLFNERIAPLISARCLECHSATEQKGDLDLSQRSNVIGDPLIVPGKPNQSLLFEKVLSGEMPPDSQGISTRLGDHEIEWLRRWIGQGAPWPTSRQIGMYERTSNVRAGLDWWSLQSVVRPKVPSGGDSVIDRLIDQRLNQSGISRAPRADRRTLIRRAYFDLIGLPPQFDEVQAFVQDDSDDAWPKLIERLLQSQHYGERWARHWLDVVRFAETSGYERDQLKPFAWKYRDWVINALNRDLPYDQFIRQQLAGDELPDRSTESLIATGFLRLGTWNDEPNDGLDYQYERLQDLVHATSSAFLGLTIKCARCHDHKFDPIPQSDYYRLASVFWPGPIHQRDRKLLGGPTDQELGASEILGWTDITSNPQPLQRLKSGNRHQPLEQIVPATLSFVPSLERIYQPPPNDTRTSLRRRQLAEWITDTQHPLTSRVMVNRIWQHHFGEGLVRTPNNFGFKGQPPTHPGLLDLLSAEFVESGWSIKHLHRLIMTSETYQQNSIHPRQSEFSSIDPQNQLWWRFNRRRLEAESVRDAMLSSSGQINLKPGGPSFFPAMSAEALEGLSRKADAWKQSPAAERRRRSIYMMTKRSRILPLMTAFDFGDTTLPCGKRDVTTVPTQALALMNNAFVHQQSESLAFRIIDEVGSDPMDQIQHAWRLALGRQPTVLEINAAQKHLEQQKKHFHAARQVGRDPLQGQATSKPIKDQMVLWLRADKGVELDDAGRVMFWRDQSPGRSLFAHDASQANSLCRPRLQEAEGIKLISFDGENDFLNLAGRPIEGNEFSILAVVSKQAESKGHREVISNWHRNGRSTRSIFLGTTDSVGVRFSDSFPNAGPLHDPDRLFAIAAINGSDKAQTFQNDRLMATAPPLNQDSSAPYVIGTQGNYGQEFWHGAIAEIIVYDSTLTRQQLQHNVSYFVSRYKLDVFEASPERKNPDVLALASLCHVLFNTNEFIYVD